ncbi:unnamed protein product [Caenorhabditis sp. 36 PRJEB53466]|nr:unnamed protein product [Caenorhabditis sp. 36 PRJEB53466]
MAPGTAKPPRNNTKAKKGPRRMDVKEATDFVLAGDPILKLEFNGLPTLRVSDLSSVWIKGMRETLNNESSDEDNREVVQFVSARKTPVRPSLEERKAERKKRELNAKKTEAPQPVTTEVSVPEVPKDPEVPEVPTVPEGEKAEEPVEPEQFPATEEEEEEEEKTEEPRELPEGTRYMTNEEADHFLLQGKRGVIFMVDIEMQTYKDLKKDKFMKRWEAYLSRERSTGAGKAKNQTAETSETEMEEPEEQGTSRGQKRKATETPSSSLSSSSASYKLRNKGRTSAKMGKFD